MAQEPVNKLQLRPRSPFLPVTDQQQRSTRRKRYQRGGRTCLRREPKPTRHRESSNSKGKIRNEMQLAPVQQKSRKGQQGSEKLFGRLCEGTCISDSLHCCCVESKEVHQRISPLAFAPKIHKIFPLLKFAETCRLNCVMHILCALDVHETAISDRSICHSLIPRDEPAEISSCSFSELPSRFITVFMTPRLHFKSFFIAVIVRLITERVRMQSPARNFGRDRGCPDRTSKTQESMAPE